MGQTVYRHQKHRHRHRHRHRHTHTHTHTRTHTPRLARPTTTRTARTKSGSGTTGRCVRNSPGAFSFATAWRSKSILRNFEYTDQDSSWKHTSWDWKDKKACPLEQRCLMLEMTPFPHMFAWKSSNLAGRGVCALHLKKIEISGLGFRVLPKPDTLNIKPSLQT